MSASVPAAMASYNGHVRLQGLWLAMNDHENLLAMPQVTPANDALASICRWGGLLLGLSLLAYVAVLA
jgi:hypothetical protein